MISLFIAFAMLGRDYFSIYTACKYSAETIFSFYIACNARQRLFFRLTLCASARQTICRCFTRDAMLGRISSYNCKRDWSWEYIVFWLILYAEKVRNRLLPGLVAVVEFRKSRIQSFLPLCNSQSRCLSGLIHLYYIYALGERFESCSSGAAANHGSGRSIDGELGIVGNGFNVCYSGGRRYEVLKHEVVEEGYVARLVGTVA